MNNNHSLSSNQKGDRISEQPKKPSKSKKKLLSSLVNVEKRLANAGSGVFQTATEVGSQAAKGSYQLLEQATSGAGEVMNYIGNLPLIKNPFVQKLAGVFRLDWLVGMTSSVDLAKAQKEVEQLKQKYPQESSFNIAHRIMVSKASQAGGVGFVSSILPGAAAALLAVDFAATTAIQTEMIYEIAAAYGMDLQDKARQGEILAIFGLALGGKNALKAGLSPLRNIPLAGAMIGASTNATMLYSLGYTACRFYEAKFKEATSEPTTETLEALQQESETYLAQAITQQTIMDQISAHMIRASYPEKNWSDIIPELKTLPIDPSSFETISTNLKSPQPLEGLLEQLNPDFALPLFIKCQQIAGHSGEVSPEEAKILEEIGSKLDPDELNHLMEENNQ
ncbi:conserved hypothetical protein [Gloeothece citriformis PCC 7424]|uniref:EcsC family protein n=1 Tax=Gloeothece citriformis (strain PCC 7424) TaxID=65393 RepID=B7KH98_GLOC7|nr:EcsC family protein [Gloeothece citriformis]ACK69307.1 conserved hypothetical protein [Gloeothece citriformis PCC 7424]